MTSAGAMKLYRIFGYDVVSEIALPGLPEARGEPELFIRVGSKPDSLSGARPGAPCYVATKDEVLISISPIGDFRMRNGTQMLVTPADGADDATIRLFVLNLAFGILLHQRGDLVLHAAAVEAGGGCVAIAGWSSAGKSTVAAALHSRGHRAVTDELMVIRDDREGPLIAPGPPFLQVWADMLDRLGWDVNGLAPVRPSLQKYLVPLGPEHPSSSLPLRAVYVLATWNRDAIETDELGATDRVEALLQNTHRLEYVTPMGLRADHFARTTALASRVPVVRVRHPGRRGTLGDLAETLESDLRRRAPIAAP